MSKQENKRLVKSFYTEVVGRGDLTELERFISPHYLDHNNPGAGQGPGVVRAHLAGIRATFPDFTLRVEQVLAEGDLVVTRLTGVGTHLGLWMGIEPTGDRIKVKGINIDRVLEGRLVEHWGEADTVRMLIQMGVDPFQGGAENETLAAQDPHKH